MEGTILESQLTDTGELTTIIDPESIARMASNHSHRRESTMYGKHGRPSRKSLKSGKRQVKQAKPQRPIEKTMPFVMLAVSVLFAVGVPAILWLVPISDPNDMIVRPVLSGVMVISAVLADVPSWVYFVSWRRKSHKA